MIPSCLPLVIQTLAEEYHIRKGIIDGKDDHRGQNALEGSPEDIKDISKKPYDEEGQGEAISRATAELRVTVSFMPTEASNYQATYINNDLR